MAASRIEDEGWVTSVLRTSIGIASSVS